MAEEEDDDVEDREPTPREDPAPTIATVKDQEMVKEIFYNPFLKCHITQTMLFGIIAALAELFLFSYVIISSVRIYF